MDKIREMFFKFIDTPIEFSSISSPPFVLFFLLAILTWVIEIVLIFDIKGMVGRVKVYSKAMLDKKYADFVKSEKEAKAKLLKKRPPVPKPKRPKSDGPLQCYLEGLSQEERLAYLTSVTPSQFVKHEKEEVLMNRAFMKDMGYALHSWVNQEGSTEDFLNNNSKFPNFPTKEKRAPVPPPEEPMEDGALQRYLESLGMNERMAYLVSVSPNRFLKHEREEKLLHRAYIGDSLSQWPKLNKSTGDSLDNNVKSTSTDPLTEDKKQQTNTPASSGKSSMRRVSWKQ